MENLIQAEDAFLLALPPGTLLQAQYEVQRVLGRPGGFGIVYLARDIHLDTLVAVKEFLPRELAGRDRDHTTVVAHSGGDRELFRYGLAQFVQEARTLGKLSHPNVVRVRSFFEAHGTAYIVMDHYEGRTLLAQLEREGGRLPPVVAVEVMIRVLDGLAAAHARDILHRDVKPENIYLTRGGHPILLDFGAARQAVGQKSRSLTAVLTPGYAPVEQYSAQGSKQGPWTDIYACAAVLYRCVTGDDPPEASDRVEQDSLEGFVFRVPGIPRHVADAIVRGMAVDRRHRPQSVREFQDLLDPQPAAPAPALPPVAPLLGASLARFRRARPTPRLTVPRFTLPRLAVGVGALVGLMLLLLALLRR